MYYIGWPSGADDVATPLHDCMLAKPSQYTATAAAATEWLRSAVSRIPACTARRHGTHGQGGQGVVEARRPAAEAVN